MASIYLDIDGVLNPFGFNRRSAWPDAEYHDVPAWGTTLRLLLSRQLGAALTDLDADIVWATTWQSQAHLVGDIVGITAPHLDLDSLGWKTGAIMHDLGQNPRPYVWIDDDEVNGLNEQALAGTIDAPQLAIRPDPSVGITPGDVDNIQQFIRSNR